MSSLQDKTISGLFWSSIHRFGVMSITFVSNIILARLLSPDDFGCIGMLMIFVSLANTFIDGGFGSALIQKQNPSNKDYSTIFIWNIVMSLLLYSILYISAPYIASFYKISSLNTILRVQGVILLLNALSIVQQTILRKTLQFKKLAVINILSATLSIVITIICAYQGLGVWSLVFQQISLSAFNAILFWITSEWKPNMVFSTTSFKELFGFGGYMLISHMFSTISNEIQGLLVGRAFSPSTMGLYTQAYKLEGTIATSTSSIIDQVTYPVLSAVQDNKALFQTALKRFVQVPAMICSPIMMIMIVLAEPIIITLFSNKWIECVPYFQILCTAGLAVCLQGAANNAIAAIGKSRTLFKWTIIKRSLTIILCVVGIHIAGMHGLLWACSIGAWSVFIINSALVSYHIGYTITEQLKDVLSFMIISIIIGYAIYYMGDRLPLNQYLVALIQVTIGITAYVVTIYRLKREVVQFTWGMISSKLRKHK